MPLWGRSEAGSPSNTKIYLQTYRHDMTYSVLKVPLNPNQPTNQPPSNTVAVAEAYLYAKFHLDPSNRLVTIHQRHRQSGQTDRTDNGPIA